MSKTKEALAWMAAGGLRKDMEADLGISNEQCRQLLNYMRRCGYIEPAYVLTDKGHERKEHVPKSNPRDLADWRAYYHRKKQAEAEKPIDRVVRRTIPNSVFALGGQ